MKAAFAAAVVVASGAAGCGSSGGTTTVIEKQATVAPSTVTVKEDAPVDTTQETSRQPAAKPRSTSNTPHGVPKLVGDRLDVAEDKLGQVGLAYKEVGGGTFGIIVKSNWIVCETDPAAGGHAQRVRLIVDREC